MAKFEKFRTLNELKNWESIRYEQIRRCQATYDETENYIREKLKFLVDEYKSLGSLQEKRLCRDLIDTSLRRFHQYSIKQRFSAFYFESPKPQPPDKIIFEHIIPESTFRDLLLDEKIDVHHALYPPVANISRDNDRKLRDAGVVSSNDDLWHPFKRYVTCGIFASATIVNYFGDEIDPDSFTLDDHYRYIYKLLVDSQTGVEFKELIERAPPFAKNFIKEVQYKFNDNYSIGYTNRPDMRIKKPVDTPGGSINTATIRWQPTKERFLLATALNQDEIKSKGFTAFIEKGEKILPSVIYLDEEIIRQKSTKILEYIKYAQKDHERRGRKIPEGGLNS